MSNRSEQLSKIPETITRSDYIALVQAAGFEIDDLISLTFNAFSIDAEVFACDPEGQRYVGGLDENGSQIVATHRVSIKVVDA